MKNEIGVLRRPSRKNEAKRPVFLTGLLAVILIVTYMFTFKVYEPVKNINITGGILIYPLSFLIISYISKYYGDKEAKRCVWLSSGLFAVFILAVMILLIPTPNNQTTSFNAVIQYLFANDFVDMGSIRVFIPLWGQFFGLVIAYITSHILYATIYNAIKNYTVDYLAMGLSAFIGFIVDRIIFMPILFAENLLEKTNTFDYFVKCITSEFIGAIMTCLVVVILYMIITTIKNRKKEKTA